MPRNTAYTARARALGAEMRRIRKRDYQGSLRAFAKQHHFSPAALSKWENGHLLPTSEQVAVFAGALNLTGIERDDLIDTARRARDPNWVVPGVDKHLSALIGFEVEATRCVSVAPALPSGMLQTEDTARAIMGNSFTEGQKQGAITTRMGRKEALFRARPLQFHAFLGMTAVKRPLGGRAVKVEQLRYILKMAKLPNITVQVIPDSDEFDPSLMGPFALYEFEVGDPIVYFEHHRSSMFAPKRDVPDMVAAVKEIEKVALSPRESAALIADVIKQMEAGL